MKRFAIFIFGMFFATLAHAETVNLSWYVDNQVYQTSTCETGGNVTPPTAPTKKGYTFQEWLAYIPIEYIESTGTQTIRIDDISAYDFDNIRMYVKWEQTGTPVTNYAGVVLLYNNENTNTYRILANEKKTGEYYANGNSIAGGGGAIVNAAMNIVHECLMQNGSVVIDGKIYTTSSKGQTLTSDNIFLMLNGFVGRIYNFWLSIDGVLRYDMIPVLDGNDTPCLYDKVTKQFFYNQGTGQFIAGPVLTE